MLRAWILILLAAPSFALETTVEPSRAEDAPPRSENLKEGIRLVLDDDCRRALGHLLGAYRHDEDKREALGWYTHCLRETDQREKSLQVARAALSTARTDAELAVARNVIGLSLLDLGRIDEALEAFDQASEAHPDPAFPLNTAIVRLRLGDRDLARAALVRMLEVPPLRDGDGTESKPLVITGHSPDRVVPATSAELEELSQTRREIDPEGHSPSCVLLDPPSKRFAPPPQYPNGARRKRVQGAVVVQAIVGRTGSVEETRVLKDLPAGLGKAAVKAVRRWRFDPAVCDGRPVSVFYNLTVNFILR